jgi:predicted membrane channel-forming protein YqfA (hemolysin III family)
MSEPNPPADHRPSWRKPAGMFLILAIITAWAGIVASFSETIGRWPVLVQLPIYVVAGLIWIAPMKPLLRWMETGRWRD